MLEVTLPPAIIGVPYKECVEVTGSLPISVVKHNLGSEGSIEMFGNLMCVTIPSPKASIDLAVELRGACTTCKNVVVTSTITASAASGGCACTPVGFEWQDLSKIGIVDVFDDEAIPQIQIGSEVNIAVLVTGSMPFEVCGGSAAKCLTIKLEGNIVTIKGIYEAEGPIMFSLKNSCSCDCAVWDYRAGGEVGKANFYLGHGMYAFGEFHRPADATKAISLNCTSNACGNEKLYVYPTQKANTIKMEDCDGNIIGWAPTR
jgi:hypothetical protein